MSVLQTTGPTFNTDPCQYCGMVHAGTCYRIKRIEYWENGAVRSIEFNDNPYSNAPPFPMHMHPAKETDA